jgi:hypothetical protein
MFRAGGRLSRAMGILLMDLPQRERVRLACVKELATLDPAQDMPDKMEAPYNAMWAKVTQFQGEGGSIDATVPRLSDDDINQIAKDIFALYQMAAEHSP